MPTKPDENDKLNAISALQSVQWDAQQLEFTLRIKGKKDDADDVWASNQRLGTEIDVLIGQAIDDWITQTVSITAKITTAGNDLVAAKQKIENDVAVATNIVKAIGLIDDVLGFAMKLATVV